MFRHFSAVLLLAILSFPAKAQEPRTYTLATGTAGGTYYPVGVAIEALSDALLARSHGLAFSVLASGGSRDNLRLLAEGTAEFAMLQGIHTRSWDNAPDTAAILPELRSITMLWPDVVHILVRSPLAETGTVRDIGRIGMAPIAIGRPDSGAMLTTTALLVGAGIEPAYLNVVDVGGYNAMAYAFESGAIDAGSLLGGPPMAAIIRAMSASGEDLTLLGFSEEDVAAANARFGELWFSHVIPAGTYPGQSQDITTAAEPNALVVRADVPEEDVYLLTKAIFQNLSFLGNMHPATREISLERAFSGMALPLHPGAVRYFTEAGATIPDALLPRD